MPLSELTIRHARIYPLMEQLPDLLKAIRYNRDGIKFVSPSNVVAGGTRPGNGGVNDLAAQLNGLLVPVASVMLPLMLGATLSALDWRNANCEILMTWFAKAALKPSRYNSLDTGCLSARRY